MLRETLPTTEGDRLARSAAMDGHHVFHSVLPVRLQFHQESAEGRCHLARWRMPAGG